VVHAGEFDSRPDAIGDDVVRCLDDDGAGEFAAPAVGPVTEVLMCGAPGVSNFAQTPLGLCAQNEFFLELEEPPNEH
jgi:hypothetical protein